MEKPLIVREMIKNASAKYISAGFTKPFVKIDNELFTVTILPIRTILIVKFFVYTLT
jgi:hypothetical protein